MFSFVPSPTDIRNIGALPRSAAVWGPTIYFMTCALTVLLFRWQRFGEDSQKVSFRIWENPP